MKTLGSFLRPDESLTIGKTTIRRPVTNAELQDMWHAAKTARKPRRQHPEFALQRAAAQFLDRALPKGALWSSIDHSGLGLRIGALLKARGVRPGLPDLMIVWRDVLLFIELKSAHGVVSDEQNEWMIALSGAGAHTCVCRSVDDVERAVKCYGIPTKATVAA